MRTSISSWIPVPYCQYFSLLTRFVDGVGFELTMMVITRLFVSTFGSQSRADVDDFGLPIKVMSFGMLHGSHGI